MEARLEAALHQRAALNRLRKLTQPDLSLVDFSSNDYLGFSRDATLRNSYKAAVADDRCSPYGPASSRLLDGTTQQHLALEAKCSEIFQSEAALLFSSGFDAVRLRPALLPFPSYRLPRTNRSSRSCPANWMPLSTTS
jgi:8-amino-7-oxononanoate synthase